MANRTINMTDELHNYILNVGIREPEVLTTLRNETHHRSDAVMQIAPEQGQFMAMLAQLMGAKRVIEVGVFTGYSSLSVARVLPFDGYLLACDINEETTTIAQSFWQQAGVDNIIDLKLGPATDTLQQALDTEGEGSFDMAFIDADKASYDAYYELCLKLVRTGGVILLDNMLWGGEVAGTCADEDGKALQALNRKIHQDQRVDMVLLPLADGINMIRKR